MTKQILLSLCLPEDCTIAGVMVDGTAHQLVRGPVELKGGETYSLIQLNETVFTIDVEDARGEPAARVKEGDPSPW